MKTKNRLVASLKTWVVIYPSITLFYYIFGANLSSFPLYQRTFVLTISLVPWMMFVAVPILDSVIQALFHQKTKILKASFPKKR
jgi:antibiotic biosynthesis monooxygenase (ABM) superfamily enzyme